MKKKLIKCVCVLIGITCSIEVLLVIKVIMFEAIPFIKNLPVK